MNNAELLMKIYTSNIISIVIAINVIFFILVTYKIIIKLYITKYILPKAIKKLNNLKKTQDLTIITQNNGVPIIVKYNDKYELFSKINF